jgi:hypothetical protein
MAGKLNGQIAAPTPSGANRVSVSMCFATSNFLPMICSGIDVVASTT